MSDEYFAGSSGVFVVKYLLRFRFLSALIAEDGGLEDPFGGAVHQPVQADPKGSQSGLVRFEDKVESFSSVDHDGLH